MFRNPTILSVNLRAGRGSAEAWAAWQAKDALLQID